MSASHSKELSGTVSELVGRRFRIVPGVGLVDRDVNDHAQLLEWVTGKVGAELLAFAERMREGKSSSGQKQGEQVESTKSCLLGARVPAPTEAV